jgi:hypothetical protein
MNTALEYSTRVVQEGGRRCKKNILNDLVHLTPLRIPLMNPPKFVMRTLTCRSTFLYGYKALKNELKIYFVNKPELS